MFFSTDQFGEFSQLAYLDFMSGDIRVLTGTSLGTSKALALAHRGSGGVSVNDEGMTTAYLFDP